MRTTITTVALGAAFLLASLQPAFATFVEPGSWTVGDGHSTYQEWDNFAATAGNTPDVGQTANPAISTDPTMSAVAPGFRTGSGNFYFFGGNHGFTSDIYNHGGTSGAGGYVATDGTHVIVQTAASLNGTNGVLPGTVEIVDLAGDAISGGGNGNALRHDVVFEGIVDFGPAGGEQMVREEIWEFYLPGHVDDFRVQGDLIVHSSFTYARVDSMIANGAMEITEVPVPEPGSLALVAMAGLALSGSARRRVRRRQA